MEANFWVQRWVENQIGFHRSAPHPLLVKHLHHLKLDPWARIFLPLCGKTLDIAWLLSRGFRVVGSELVEMAVVQLFEELGVKPQIERNGKLLCYSAHNVEIFVGDVFEITPEVLGAVDGVYDRAALVALPAEMRSKYSDHLLKITKKQLNF